MKPIELLQFLGLPMEFLSSTTWDDIERVTVEVDSYHRSIAVSVFRRQLSVLRFYKRPGSGWVNQ